MVMHSFFPWPCAFTSVASASCRLFDTCCDPAVPFSLYSCLYRKDGLFGDKIFDSLRLMNQLATIERVWTATGRKQWWFFFFSEDLWGCFIASVSSGSYQTWLSRLIPCQHTTFSNDRLLTQARPIPFPWQLQHRLDIRYKHWKRSALWNMSLACKTKPTGL